MGSDWLGWNMKGSWAARRSCLQLFNILKDEQRLAPLLQYDWSNSANVDETVKSLLLQLKLSVLKVPKSYFRLDHTRLIQTGSRLQKNKKGFAGKKRESSMWIKQHHICCYRLKKNCQSEDIDSNIFRSISGGTEHTGFPLSEHNNTTLSTSNRQFFQLVPSTVRQSKFLYSRNREIFTLQPSHHSTSNGSKSLQHAQAFLLLHHNVLKINKHTNPERPHLLQKQLTELWKNLFGEYIFIG